MSRSGARFGTLPAGDHDDQAATIIAAGQSALSAIVICPAAAIGHMARAATSRDGRGSSFGSPCMPASAALPLARDLAAKQDRAGIAEPGRREPPLSSNAPHSGQPGIVSSAARPCLVSGPAPIALPATPSMRSPAGTGRYGRMRPRAPSWRPARAVTQAPALSRSARLARAAARLARSASPSPAGRPATSCPPAGQTISRRPAFAVTSSSSASR